MWWPKMGSSWVFYICSWKLRSKQKAMKKWPNRKKWCSNPMSYRHFACLPCTDRYTSVWKCRRCFNHNTSSVLQWPLFLLASFHNHMFLEDICWKYRYSFAHVTLNNLEASRRAACGVRFSLTSWNFEGSLISPGRNSMSCTLQHPAADTSLRKGENIVSEGHRHILPRDRRWLLAEGCLEVCRPRRSAFAGLHAVLCPSVCRHFSGDRTTMDSSSPNENTDLLTLFQESNWKHRPSRILRCVYNTCWNQWELGAKIALNSWVVCPVTEWLHDGTRGWT